MRKEGWKNMSRIISDIFIKELKTGVLMEVLKAVKNDNTLDFEIRKNFINIYYRGGSLMKIEEKTPAIYEFFFNRKYLDKNVTKVSVPEKQLIKSSDPQCMNDVKIWVDAIPNIKHEMDLYFTKSPKEEREFQQLVLHENNYGGPANDTDYYICDIEYANNNGRFDMIAVKWPSKSAIRKDCNNLELAFIEMKYMDKALAKKSGIVDHIINMNNFLGDTGAVNALKNEMKEIFNLKIDLGLLEGINKIQSFNTKDNNKLEYIFLIANHDPDKSVLERELNILYKSLEYSSFKQKANLKISFASFMGYGLYRECVLDLDNLIDHNGNFNIKLLYEQK